MKKKIAIILTVTMLLGVCFAVANAANKKYECHEKKLGYKTFRGLPHKKYTIGGKTAFCLERDVVAKPEVKSYSKGSLKSIGLSKNRWHTICYIANIGYNSKRDSDAWYCATQQVIWEKLHSWNIKNNRQSLENKSTVPSYSSKKKTILNELNTMKAVKSKKVKFDKTSLSKKDNKALTVTIKDKNKVLSKGYKVTSTPTGVTAKISGNSLYVTAAASVKKGTIVLQWTPNKAKIDESTFWISSGSQNLAPIGGKIKTITTKVGINSTPEDIKRGEIEIQKEILYAGDVGDESNINLIGENPDWTQMQFTFYADENIMEGSTLKYHKGDAIRSYSPNSEGIITIKDILPGKYYLKETKTLKGLATDENTKYPIIATKNSDGDVDVGITIPTNPEMQTTINVENGEVIKYQNFITVKTTDELTKEKILELAHASANKAEFTNPDDTSQYTEGESVSLDIPDLEGFLQEYKATESTGIFHLTLKTEAGSEASFDVYAVNPTANRADYDATIYNHTIPVAITKTDITGDQEIEGAHLVLSDKDGKVVAEWDSTTEPYIIEGLNRGEEYTLKETIAPDNYVLSQDEVKFTIEDDWSVQEHAMTNMTASFRKVDEEGNLLNGAEIEIIDKETGEVIDSFTTDYGTLEDRGGSNDKLYYLSGLKEGRTYIVREVKAPVGYQVAKDIEFTLTKEKAENQTEITSDGEKPQENNDSDNDDDQNMDDQGDDSQGSGDSDINNDQSTDDSQGTDGQNTNDDQIIGDDSNGNDSSNIDDEEGEDPTDDEEENNEEDNDALTDSCDIMITMEDKKINIHTTALDASTNDHISNATKNIVINDTVKYENLTIGKEYFVEGYLVDKKTGKALKDDKGNVIKSVSEKFKAEKENGTVVIPFKFSGVKLKGKTTVAYETLYEDDIEVAVHHDINDEGQTVVIPKIGTRATINGKKVVKVGSVVTVKDTVKYKNLIPGKKYTMTGKLIKTSSKTTVDTKSKTFTAKKKNGTVVINFKVDTNKTKGCKLVAFEKVKYKGKLVATHEDINDGGQTVTIEDEPDHPQPTGDDTSWWIFGIIGALTAIAGITIYRKRKVLNK